MIKDFFSYIFFILSFPFIMLWLYSRLLFYTIKDKIVELKTRKN